uniref:Uncharacterized protein n=1 Tax=viral metagenome TaxID=1070528 RepID=A0A6M3JKR7_9ZZZZ
MEIKDWEKEIEVLNPREKREIVEALHRLLNWSAFKGEYKELETLSKMVAASECKFKNFDAYWNTKVEEYKKTYSPWLVELLHHTSSAVWESKDKITPNK